MPLALVGIIALILVWDSLRRAGDEWGLDRNGYGYRTLAFVGNGGTTFCNKYIYFFWFHLVFSFVIEPVNILQVMRAKVLLFLLYDVSYSLSLIPCDYLCFETFCACLLQ